MKLTKPIISTIWIVTLCVGCSVAGPASTATDIPSTITPISPTDTPAPTAETSTEPPVEFPYGKFYNSGFDSYVIINIDGTWRLLEGKNRTFFTGLYEVEEDRVIFTEWSGYCSEFGNGIYSWNFLEGVLSIKTIKDDCELRSARLTLPYTQQ